MNFILLSIIIGSLYAFLILTILHKQSRSSLSTIKNVTRSSISTSVGLLLLLVPLVFYYASQPDSFPSPDTYGYIMASYLNVWSDMPIDSYYKQFPIYVILNKFLGSSTGLEYFRSLIVIHLSSVLLLYLLIIILMRKLDKNFLQTSPLLSIFVSALLIATIYLYSYLNLYIPQTFSLSIFLYLLISALNKRPLLLILFSIPALVHVSVVPMYIVVMVPGFLLLYLFQKSISSSYEISLFILPLFFYSIYQLYYVNFSFVIYLNYYINLIQNIIFKPEKVGISLVVTQSVSSTLNFYNAFALAFHVSLYIVGLYLIIRRIQYHPLVIIFGIFSGFLLLLGFTKYYVATDIPSYSVARYVNVYGFLFLTLFNIYTLTRLFNIAHNKIIRYIVVIAMFLAVIGALTDPFTFPYKPTSEDVAFSKMLVEIISEKTSIYFVNSYDQYYLSPLLSFWNFMLHNLSNYPSALKILASYAIQATQHQNIVFCTNDYCIYLYKSDMIYVKRIVNQYQS